ncbi:MAG: ATP-binding cassette domain-containing protein [Actinomycetaceae bacterium]|nr:ATP-binding cassette domain-containing protein [Actinomycetaceae bacterium]MDY6082935.1 ATP-binding cassette domain-containing protein [Actinomycetaceae bacterium]
MRRLAREALDKVELSARTSSRISKLSGGMRQRAGLAAAIVGSPTLLLLDEPTVGLDPAQRYAFKEVLREYRDTTIILSTHIVEDVAVIADSVTVINDGRKLFAGSVEGLAREGQGKSLGDSPLERGYLAVTRESTV